MTGERRAARAAEEAMVYQIRLKGHLGRQRMDWFEGLTIILEEDGNTLLTGILIDQAALHGILKKIRDLGMPLLLVHAMDFDPEDAKQATHG